MKREDLFEAIGAVDNEYLEHSERTQKRGHRILYRVGLVAAAVVLLCGTAMAFPAVREAVGEMLGIKTERGSNTGYVTIDGVTQNQKNYTVQPSITPAEDALTRFETVYRPTYMPEGYSEDYGDIWASYSGNEDCTVDYKQVYFCYGRDADAEFLHNLSSERVGDDLLRNSTLATAPNVCFEQHLAVDFAAEPGLFTEQFSGVDSPEMQTVTLGDVECQYISGTEVIEYIAESNKTATVLAEKKIVFWSDGDYVFVLRTRNTDFSVEELGRIIASVGPLEDCSPYLRVYNADENAKHDAIQTVYMPTSMPEGWKKGFTYVNEAGDSLNCSWFKFSANGTKEFLLDQYSYRDAKLLEILLSSKNETRIINSTEITFKKEVIDFSRRYNTPSENVERLLAAWEKDGNYFVAMLNGEDAEVDELAELIASLAPNESINIEDYKDESVDYNIENIETFYLPELSDEWTLTFGGYWDCWASFEWIAEDYAGVCFEQYYGFEPDKTGYFHENTREEWIGDVQFIINDGSILAIWEQDGNWMILECNDGDTTKWTADDVAALVESVHSVEDITPYLSGE